MTAKKILITGGTGTVGGRLTSLLLAAGHKVAHLSRSSKQGSIKTYQWDINSMKMDPLAISENDVIIHLAGAGVFDKRWSAEYRKEIIDSRIQSTQLLYDYIKSSDKKPEAFISASAIGIYGSETTEKWYVEETPAANGFLSDVVMQWESAADHISTLGIRTVKLRIGIVLSEKGGALEQLALPVKYGVGASLGRGNQWVPWIHVEDLCRMFQYAVEHEELIGVYNAVNPRPVTNSQLTQAIAKVLDKPLWIPAVPSFALELVLGKEKAAFVLGGSRVSADKIINTGFLYQFGELHAALEDLL